MRQSYKQQHQKAKSKRKSAMDLKNLCILPKNSAEDLRARKALLGICTYLRECTPKIATSSP